MTVTIKTVKQGKVSQSRGVRESLPEGDIYMNQDLNSEAASGHGRSFRAGRAKALPVRASWGKEARVAGVERAGMGRGWWQMRLERHARARSCRLLRLSSSGGMK